MVLEAMRIESTCCRPNAQRCTARTILFTSTDSSVPLRFFTCMTGVSSREGKPGVMSDRLVCRVVVAIVLLA